MTVTSGIIDNSSEGGVTFQSWKNWYRQDPITADPLPYRMLWARRTNVTSSLFPGWEHVKDSYGLNVCQNVSQWGNFIRNGIVYPTTPVDLAYNQAYEKFTSSVRGDVAELLVNLAERKEALLLMLNRFIRIINAVRAFRQLDFRAAATHLGVAVPPSTLRKRWATSRQWGANWLEWHFGWSPLLGDIHSVTEILDATFPWAKVVESSGTKLDYDVTATNGPIVGSGTERETFQGLLYCRISSEIEVSDLTLLKANQLGLINPAQVVWELIPFSFLADWFGTVGLWLGQFTDFCGLTLRRPQYVYYFSGTGHKKLDSAFYGRLEFDFHVAGVMRDVGSIPGPTLSLRRLKGLSVTRGLTAISLILGLFAPH